MQTCKFLKGSSIKFAEHFVIVQTRIVTSILSYTGDVGTFELLKHTFNIVVVHLRSVVTDDRTEVQKLSKFYSVALAGSRFCADFCGLSQDFQSSIRRKIKNIAVLFSSAVICRVWTLNTEDGLHISLGICIIGTGKHHYCRPRPDCYSGCKFSTRESDSPRVFRVITHSFFYEFERIVTLDFLVTVSCNIYYFELPENRMFF